MAAAAPTTGGPSLARAFLALADDREPVVERSLRRGLAALAAAVVLACGAPLAWSSGERLKADQPAATLGSKSSAVAGIAGDEDDG